MIMEVIKVNYFLSTFKLKTFWYSDFNPVLPMEPSKHPINLVKQDIIISNIIAIHRRFYLFFFRI